MKTKKKQTLLEKHGRFGANMSVSFDDYALLEKLRVLLNLKSRSAVIHFLAEKFRKELNQLDIEEKVISKSVDK